MHQFNAIYALFVLIIFVFYSLIPKSNKLSYLLFGSLAYYVYIEPKFFFLFFLLIIITYFAAKEMDKFKGRNRKYVLWLYLCFLLSIYLPFKYNYIYSLIFNDEKNTHVLPLGISFFTFHISSYVFDVYYKKIKSAEKFIEYALYISFFPQIVCGPIERFEKVEGQFENMKSEDPTNWVEFAYYLYTGFFKKFVMANGIAIFAIALNSKDKLSGLEWVILAILIRYHLFLDFSGYTDIAISIGKLFGINFTNNFNRPFAASTIDEFWRRWHITLSTWIRDYIFYPSIGFAKNVTSVYFFLFLSFVFLGIWHGGDLNYVLYGALNGLAIVITLIVRKYIAQKKALSFLKFLAWPFNFVFFVSLPTILLRVSSLEKLRVIASSLFTLNIQFFHVSEKMNFVFEKIWPYIPLVILLEIGSFVNKEQRIIKWLNRRVLKEQLFILFICGVLAFVFYNAGTSDIPYVYEKY